MCERGNRNPLTDIQTRYRNRGVELPGEYQDPFPPIPTIEEVQAKMMQEEGLAQMRLNTFNAEQLDLYRSRFGNYDC